MELRRRSKFFLVTGHSDVRYLNIITQCNLIKVICLNKISPDLAEIIGLLCAEGSYILQYSSYWGKDKGKARYYKNDKSERIEFYNNDTKLLY